MSDAPPTLIRELLARVVAPPRTYAEAMEAWRTSCPRLPVREDATDAGLVAVVHHEGGGFGGASVELTARGAELLAGKD